MAWITRTRKETRSPFPKSAKKRQVIPFEVDERELRELDRKAKERGVSRYEVIRLPIKIFAGK